MRECNIMQQLKFPTCEHSCQPPESDFTVLYCCSSISCSRRQFRWTAVECWNIGQGPNMSMSFHVLSNGNTRPTLISTNLPRYTRVAFYDLYAVTQSTWVQFLVSRCVSHYWNRQYHLCKKIQLFLKIVLCLHICKLCSIFCSLFIQQLQISFVHRKCLRNTCASCVLILCDKKDICSYRIVPRFTHWLIKCIFSRSFEFVQSLLCLNTKKKYYFCFEYS